MVWFYVAIPANFLSLKNEIVFERLEFRAKTCRIPSIRSHTREFQDFPERTHKLCCSFLLMGFLFWEFIKEVRDDVVEDNFLSLKFAFKT